MRGHVSAPMDGVRAAFEAAGCVGVRSYIQSGNILFEADSAAVLQRVHDELGILLGAPAVVMLRQIEELDAIAALNPFGALTSDKALKLYVVFLETPPSREIALPVIAEKEALEIVAVVRREAYVVSRRRPTGIYGFPNILVENELGVAATSRNWNTLMKLRAFASGGAPSS